MEPKIIIAVTTKGIEIPVINADTEQEQTEMEEVLKRIQPCLDVADAILKKSDPRPKRVVSDLPVHPDPS